MPTDGCYDENIPFPNSWCQGLVARLRGDEAAARAAFTNAREELEQTCATNLITRRLSARSVWLMLRWEIRRTLFARAERAVELMPVSKSAHRRPDVDPISGRHLCVGRRKGSRNRTIGRSRAGSCREAMLPTAICVSIRFGIRCAATRALKQSSLRSRRSSNLNVSSLGSGPLSSRFLPPARRHAAFGDCFYLKGSL